jgi:hypothetical protein
VGTDQPMNFSDWAGAVQSIIAAGAIIVAGIWAFFRFVKGRTFKYKAELTVEGSVLSARGRRAISARVHLRNTGLTKTPLERAFVRVLAMRPSDWESGKWKRLVTVRVFEDHDWIEPQEPIGDELLIPLSEESPALAYRLDAIVLPPKNLGRKRIQWSARQVIGGVLQPTGVAEARTVERSVVGVGQEERRKIGEQRAASDEEVAAYEREAREDEGQKQRAPSEEEVERYEEETRQRHPSEDEVTSLEEEAQGGDQQSGDED